MSSTLKEAINSLKTLQKPVKLKGKVSDRNARCRQKVSLAHTSGLLMYN